MSSSPKSVVSNGTARKSRWADKFKGEEEARAARLKQASHHAPNPINDVGSSLVRGIWSTFEANVRYKDQGTTPYEQSNAGAYSVLSGSSDEEDKENKQASKQTTKTTFSELLSWLPIPTEEKPPVVPLRAETQHTRPCVPERRHTPSRPSI